MVVEFIVKPQILLNIKFSKSRNQYTEETALLHIFRGLFSYAKSRDMRKLRLIVPRRRDRRRQCVSKRQELQKRCPASAFLLSSSYSVVNISVTKCLTSALIFFRSISPSASLVLAPSKRRSVYLRSFSLISSALFSASRFPALCQISFLHLCLHIILLRSFYPWGGQ